MNRRKRSPLLWISLVSALVATAACAFWWLRGADDQPQYQTATVKTTDIVNAVTASGQLSAVVNVQVGSQISGNIKTLLADFNTPVKAGQIVAQLDPATFEAVVSQAEGELANAEASLELARLNERRQRELAANKIAPPADMDKATADLHQAEAAVKIRRAALEKARIDLARCTIYAPVDGVVVSRNVDVGQTVAATMTAPVLFTIAGDLSQMHIEANVSEADIGGIKEGMDASFTVDAFPERTFHGKVSQVRYAPVTVDNVVTYVTVIEVRNDKLDLRPGMTANVSIVVAEKKGVLAVPNAALRFKPTATGTGSSPFGEGRRSSGPPRTTSSDRAERKRNLYQLEGTTPKPVEVGLGISDGIFTEVTQGLKEGDAVITGRVATKASAAPAANPFGGGAPPGGPRRGGL